MRRLLLLTLLTPLLWLTGPVSSQASALPCPEPPRFGRQLDSAAFVFTGRITGTSREADEAVYDVTVRRVYMGTGIEKHETIYGPTTVDECRLAKVEVGQKWLFLAGGEPEHLETSSFAGSQKITDEVQRRVENRLGEGSLPAPDEPEVPPTATLTNVADGGPETFWPLSLPGFALVGIGLVVMAAARGLGRRADRHA